MRTTGGALAFEWLVPPYEATLTKNLRDAGAIIIAKTGMTELANYVAGGMPTNYNAVHGYGINPYDPRRDPRNDGRPILQTGGSSSGIGTAANFWAGNVGTETSGSILSPSNQNMLAAVKPTVGRISRYGVIPITADQDTPGPMAKYVMGHRHHVRRARRRVAGSERRGDEGVHAAARAATTRSSSRRRAEGRAHRHPAQELLRAFDHAARRRAAPRGGLNPAQAKVMDEAIAALKAAGATVIDVDIPSMLEKDPKENLLTAGQSIVLNYGMKRDFNTWLASLGAAAPVKTLTELREWNTAHERLGAIKYGQSQLDASDQIDLEKDRAKYEEDRARDIRVFGTNGIDAAVKANNLDALLFPGPGSAGIASKPGYPTVLVPFGMIPNNPGARSRRWRRRPRPRDAPRLRTTVNAARGGWHRDAGDAPPAGRRRQRRATPATAPARPRAAAAAAAAGVRSEAAAVRRRLHRSGVQRAEAAAARLRFEQATKKRIPPPGLR